MKRSPESTSPRCTVTPLIMAAEAAARSVRVESVGIRSIWSEGITKRGTIGLPSKSCWTRASATTTSPRETFGWSPPATPVNTMLSGSNRSSFVVTVEAAATLPKPEMATTAS